MEVEKLIEFYPRLYHMAERDAWASIKEHGLLSTSAVLDRHGLNAQARIPFESNQRQVKMNVTSSGADSIVLRDQGPMPPSRLERVLQDGLTPRDWYQLINSKVFFWTSEDRLHTLLKAYGDFEHDVLTLDTASLVKAYEASIWLCHMNSGNTKPYLHNRGATTFRRIADYPAKRNGDGTKKIAELVVDYSVPDISKYVLQVRRMKKDEVIEGVA